MTFTKLLAGSAALALITGTAAAQDQMGQGTEDTGLYVGGGYTFLDIESEEDIGDNTNALTGRLGWQIIPNFALEGEATFGIDDGEFDYDGDEDDFDFDDNNDGDLDDVLNADGELGLDYLVGLYGKYTLPVTDAVDLYARAGYAFAEIDATFETAGGNEFSIGGSESGFAFGGGAGLDMTESSTVRLDYTRYEFEDANADGVNVTYEHKF
ncbi:outer membrane beta-barrel protein [Parvularcula marina]|uniref:outer membrane beta-barrel protein n=1 Tax=Parvularcula marina TaxID=2292771 RepID=UPI003516D4F5